MMQTAVRFPEEPISVKQAALEFKVSVSTIWKYVHQGHLHSWCRPMDRQTWLDRKEIEELVTWIPKWKESW